MPFEKKRRRPETIERCGSNGFSIPAITERERGENTDTQTQTKTPARVNYHVEDRDDVDI